MVRVLRVCVSATTEQTADTSGARWRSVSHGLVRWSV